MQGRRVVGAGGKKDRAEGAKGQEMQGRRVGGTEGCKYRVGGSEELEDGGAKDGRGV